MPCTAARQPPPPSRAHPSIPASTPSGAPRSLTPSLSSLQRTPSARRSLDSRREVEPAHVVPPLTAEDQDLKASGGFEKDYGLSRRVVAFHGLADGRKQHRGLRVGL